ncbi:hypothetical protein PUR71_00920 [Streptomyces sp. SP17BM10]|uniref:hypothetical protein n=1 Tax=Streptomyces sp. SP17BM10 TaxID=3002530 RepID=UPI002E76B51A|nr:hypothetical protein [Streptomyces sp. SP17BM10]MEE1781508.1 hypothetical protein [Streptomyces sp. SP17BM10]
MTDQTAADLAIKVEKTLHELVYATMGPDYPGLEYPGDVYTTVAGLKEGVGRLPQTATQLAKFIEHLAAGDHLRLDHDGDLAARRKELINTFNAVVSAANQLYSALNNAHTHLHDFAYKD